MDKVDVLNENGDKTGKTATVNEVSDKGL